MGSRKISLEPAASVLGLPGFNVMKVSLCGPHSLETSTLAPAADDAVPPGAGSEPNLASHWYFSHQVGLSEPLVCADSEQANPRTRQASGRIFFDMRPPKKIDAEPGFYDQARRCGRPQGPPLHLCTGSWLWFLHLKM